MPPFLCFSLLQNTKPASNSFFSFCSSFGNSVFKFGISGTITQVISYVGVFLIWLQTYFGACKIALDRRCSFQNIPLQIPMKCVYFSHNSPISTREIQPPFTALSVVFTILSQSYSCSAISHVTFTGFLCPAVSLTSDQSQVICLQN